MGCMQIKGGEEAHNQIDLENVVLSQTDVLTTGFLRFLI